MGVACPDDSELRKAIDAIIAEYEAAGRGAPIGQLESSLKLSTGGTKLKTCTVPTIDPRVVGPPPERHAARVVADMARWLGGERARLSGELTAALQRSKSRFGSPIAQQHLVTRLRKAGGKGILDLRLRPGKCGNFVLSIVEWWVHDPARNDMIFLGDPLPDKPWLQRSATVWPYKRRDEQWTVTPFLLSNHAMQRLAERCGARTPFDLPAAVDELWRGLEPIDQLGRDRQQDTRRRA